MQVVPWGTPLHVVLFPEQMASSATLCECGVPLPTHPNAKRNHLTGKTHRENLDRIRLAKTNPLRKFVVKKPKDGEPAAEVSQSSNSNAPPERPAPAVGPSLAPAEPERPTYNQLVAAVFKLLDPVDPTDKYNECQAAAKAIKMYPRPSS